MDYLGTGLIAFLGIAVWDTVRMLIQTWWIKRSLNNNVPNYKCNYCSHCGSVIKSEGEGDGKDTCDD